MYAGASFEHWGHFLTEITNRLYWFIENRNKYPNIKLAFIQYIDPNFDFTNTYSEFLSMLGITKNDYIFVKKHTKFKMVIVPEYSAMLGTKYKKEFVKIFDLINKQIEPAKYKKIYFSKTKISKEGNIIGEDDFQKIFKKNGFKITVDNSNELKEKLIWMLNNKNKLKEIGQKGRQIYLDYFSIEKLEKKLEKILCINKNL